MKALAIACAAATASLAASAAAHPTRAPAACPPRPRAPVNTWTKTRAQVLPHGATALRLCRYAAASGGSALVRQRLVTSVQTISTIERRIARLPASAGVYACPLDDGSAIAILASYRTARRVSVSVRPTGCRTVTNGRLVRLADGASGPGPQLIRQLLALTS